MANTTATGSSSGAKLAPSTLSREELISLIEATYSSSTESLRDLRDVVGLITNGGVRPGELAHLRWTDVDFAGGFITVKQTKAGVLRRIPLGSSFALIVRKRHARMQGTEYVLGRSPASVLRRTAKQLKTLSGRVLGRELQLRHLLPCFYKRWLREGCNSPAMALSTLELVTGRRGETCLRNYLSPEHRFRLATEIMQRIQI